LSYATSNEKAVEIQTIIIKNEQPVNPTKIIIRRYKMKYEEIKGFGAIVIEGENYPGNNL